MTVEYFGRQYEITPAIRDEVESGLGKLTKILGDNFQEQGHSDRRKASQHRGDYGKAPPRPRGRPGRGHRHGRRRQPGARAHRDPGASHTMAVAAPPTAKPKDKSWKAPVEAEAEMQIAVGATPATAVPVVVHKFPVHRPHHGGAPGASQRFCGHASHDGGGSGEGMRVPRPRGLRLSRRQRQGQGPASAQGRQDRADRSAVSRIPICANKGACKRPFYFVAARPNRASIAGESQIRYFSAGSKFTTCYSNPVPSPGLVRPPMCPGPDTILSIS